MIILWNKQKGTGGSGSGKGGFPTIVTDSGSSLPSASGYQEGDTFLNTSDKKVYKTEETITGYTLAENVNNNNYNSTNVVVDLTTGIASDFKSGSNYNYFFKSGVDKRWIGDKEYKVHFKITSNLSATTLYNIFTIYNATGYQSMGDKGTYIAIGVKENKLYIQSFSVVSSMGSGSYTQLVAPIEILDYSLEKNVEYFLTINKTTGGNITTSISSTSYTENILKTQTTSTGISDVNTYSETCTFFYGQTSPFSSSSATTLYNTYGQSFTVGQIYLGDSSGEMVTATIVKDWDSGTDLTDKTEYADKTNGALYLYENSELVKIGGALKKKVYTISADNTSTLDVSSDFTKIIDVLKNGVELAITDDYTISSGVITFVTALSTTDKITVKGE